MYRMQVTFNDAVHVNHQSRPGNFQHVSLMFHIDFRGRRYDCVGHLKRFDDNASYDSSVVFTGYHGYNGPIDIEKLRNAALDYYQLMSADASDEKLATAKHVEIDVAANRFEATDSQPWIQHVWQSTANESYKPGIANFADKGQLQEAS